MAVDDDKTTVAMNDAAEEPAPKKGPNKLLVFGGLGLGVVIVGVVLALFVIKPMLMKSDDGHSAAKTEETDKSDHKKSEKGEGGGVVYTIKDIVINPAGTGGSRFLSVSFGFELGSAALAREFEDREPLVRDALITILSSKTVAQLTDIKQKEIMRYQIKHRLSQLFQTEDLEGVYYTDFVLQ